MVASVVGIDIGSTAVRAVELTGASRALPTVLKYHAVPLPAQ